MEVKHATAPQRRPKLHYTPRGGTGGGHGVILTLALAHVKSVFLAFQHGVVLKASLNGLQLMGPYQPYKQRQNTENRQSSFASIVFISVFGPPSLVCYT